MARILVLEDDEAVLATVRRHLEAGGHEVLTASDGRKALELVEQTPVDLSLVDVFVPEMDGMEFTIRLRRQRPNARIIVMSGGGIVDKDTVLAIAEHLGAVRALAKPFTRDELLAAVQAVLDGPAGE